jgi:16S rRNA (uracil1498-N3)-methyltransferase
MHRFFLHPDQWRMAVPRLDPAETRHLATVLRLGAGDEVQVFDGEGREAAGRVRCVSRDGASLILGNPRQSPPPAVAVTLFQALPKGSKMDWIVQKATELGVTAIVPVLTERAVPRLNAREGEAKCVRWRAIALNAAKQCGASRLPAIGPIATVEDVAQRPGDYDLFLLGSLERDAVSLRRALDGARARRIARVAVLIGPEGDLTPEEGATLRGAGAVAVGFGPRTLRAETAALFVLSVLTFALFESCREA